MLSVMTYTQEHGVRGNATLSVHVNVLADQICVTSVVQQLQGWKGWDRDGTGNLYSMCITYINFMKNIIDIANALMFFVSVL